MKKLTLIVSALALVMGFSQCKKDNLTPNDNRIQITLNANYGGNGSKTTFDPANGTFEWLQGYGAEVVEYINVGGSQSGYLGQLNNNDNKGTGTFNGSITTPQDGETLYFFYLGNGDHAGATTLDFSNQSSGTVTDWHIAIGSADYSGTNYNVTLNMAMAIAYFDLNQFKSSTDAAETVYIHGDAVYATATINYDNGTITGNTKGFINVGTANAGKYVALIPSVTTSTTVKFESNTKTGSMTFLRGIKPASYYSNSGSALAPTLGILPEGATPGLFTVAGEEVNGNKISTRMVRFSKGNLQYHAEQNKWQFADKQYNIIGSYNANVSSSYNGWIDLFGWGTSGWDNGNEHYQPYKTAKGTETYGYGYGPKVKSGYTYSTQYSIVGDYSEADWGVHNVIGNDAKGTWRTPTGGTNGEFNYIINNRSTDNRFVESTIDGKLGVILLPDSYTHPEGITAFDKINMTSNFWATNTYNADAWTSIEAAGAVFLPWTGQLDQGSYNSGSTYNLYWSSIHSSNKNAYTFNLGSSTVSSTDSNSSYRYKGNAVRLVYDVQ